MLITIELALGFAAGLLFRPDEWKTLKLGWLTVSIVLSVVVTVFLMFGWWLDILPFDFPVRSWTLLMLLMGLYESAGFLLANFLVPWAPFRTRAKTGLAIASAAIVVGHLTYGGGDLMMLPGPLEFADYFARGALFAAIAVFAGLTVSQRQRRAHSTAV